jgi:hypothetical protein
MAQGGGKPTNVVPKRVGKKDKQLLFAILATQPCPNDKWGKRITNKEIKVSPSPTILGGWLSQSLSQGVGNNNLQNDLQECKKIQENASLKGTSRGLATMLEMMRKEESCYPTSEEAL